MDELGSEDVAIEMMARLVNLSDINTIQGKNFLFPRMQIHSCQPSRNGRDSPGSLGLVPAVSRSRQNSNKVPEFIG